MSFFWCISLIGCWAAICTVTVYLRCGEKVFWVHTLLVVKFKGHQTTEIVCVSTITCSSWIRSRGVCVINHWVNILLKHPKKLSIEVISPLDRNRSVISCFYLCVFFPLVSIGRPVTETLFTDLQPGRNEIDVFQNLSSVHSVSFLFIFKYCLFCHFESSKLYLMRKVLRGGKTSARKIFDVAQTQVFNLIYTRYSWLVELLPYRVHLSWCKFPTKPYRCLLLFQHAFSRLSFTQNQAPIRFTFLINYCTVGFGVKWLLICETLSNTWYKLEWKFLQKNYKTGIDFRKVYFCIRDMKWLFSVIFIQIYWNLRASFIMSRQKINQSQS